MNRRMLIALTLGLALTACTPPNAAPTGSKIASNAKAKPASASTLKVTGQVTAPAGIIATGGGNIIAAGGGNIIAAGGGNYRLLAVEEKPLANTTVFLADGAGNAVAGVKEAVTDSKGNYTLEKVPKGGPYQVLAKGETEDGKPAMLRSLVQLGASGGSANVGTATSMVCAKMLKDGGGKLGAFDAATWTKAVKMVSDNMDADDMPADWGNLESVAGAMNALSAAMPELDAAMNSLSEAMAEAAKRIEDAKNQIEDAGNEAQRAASDALGALNGLGSL